MEQKNDQVVEELTDVAVCFRHVSEKFFIYRHKADSIKEKVMKGMALGKGERKEIWALKDVDLSIPKGAVVGLIGENGSGKTTLLKLIAGILKPDAGSIEIAGKVAAILQLGVGFQRDLSGRENVYLNSAMLGIPKRVIDARIDDIIRFAEIDEFIDMPLKTYSSGMEMRLGFSIAVHVDPDILLIDEVLIIGDEAFQKKCFRYIEECKNQGKTIILVSHSMDLVRRMCDVTFLLRKGEVIASGETAQVVNYYYQTCGLRDGIAIIARQGKEVVFNNGQLYVLHESTSLFPDPGLFFEFSINGKPCYSYNAEWKVVSVQADSLSVKGRFPFGEREILFEVCVEEGGEIVYSIRQEGEFLPLVVTLATHACYEEWFAFLQGGSFAGEKLAYDEKVFDKCVPLGEPFGLGSSEEGFPSLIQCINQVDSTVSFLHGRSQANLKTISMSFSALEVVQGSITIISEPEACLCARSRCKERFTVSSEVLSVFVDPLEKQVGIEYDGQPISHAEGFLLSFLCEHAWINNRTCAWSVQKVSDSLIKLEATLSESGAMYETSFGVHGADIEIRSSLHAHGAEIEQPQLSLIVSEAYETWRCEFDEGIFDSPRDDGWKKVLIPKVGVPNLFGFVSPEEKLPDLVVSCDPQDDLTFHLFNLKHYGLSRAVSLVSQAPDPAWFVRLAFLKDHRLKDLQECYYAAYVCAFFDSLYRHSISSNVLRCVFCDGYYSFYDESELVTPLPGVGFSFSIDGKVVHSSEIGWTIEKCAQDHLICTGVHEALHVQCVLDLVLSEASIQPSISFDSKIVQRIKNFVFDVPIFDAYSSWVCNQESGVFSFDNAIFGEANTITVAQTEEVELCALFSPTTQRAVVLDSMHTEGSAHVRLNAVRDELPSFLLRVAVDDVSVGQVVSFVLKTMAVSQLVSMRDEHVEKRTISSEHVRVTFNAKQIAIHYDEIEITHGAGMYSVVTGAGYSHNSAEFEWAFEKISPKAMKIIGKLPALPFSFEWLFSVYDDSFEIHVRSESSEVLPFDQTQFVFLVKEKYENWFCNLSKGTCMPVDPQANWEEISIPNNEFVDLCALTTGEGSMPGIIFTDGVSSPTGRVYLYNTLQQGKARAVSYLSSLHASRETFHFVFSFTASNVIERMQEMLWGVRIAQLMMDLFVHSITDGNMTLIFTGGCLRLFYDGQEITSVDGGKVLLFCGAAWRIPEKDAWICERVSSSVLSARVMLPGLEQKEELRFSLVESRLHVEVVLKDALYAVEKCNIVFGLNEQYSAAFFNDDTVLYENVSGETQWEKKYSYDSDPSVCGICSVDDLPALAHIHDGQGVGDVSFTAAHQKKTVSYTMGVKDVDVFTFVFTVAPEARMQEFVSAVYARRGGEQERKIVSFGSLDIVFENGCFHLYRESVKLTIRKGLYASFIFEDKKYDSDDFVWELEKSLGETLLCIGRHPTLLITQTWSLSISGDAVNVVYSCSHEEEAITLHDFYLECMVSDVFSEWLMNDRRASFVPISAAYTFDDVPGGYLDGAEILGVMTDDASALVLSHFSDAKFHPRILNYSESISGRSLRVSRETLVVNTRESFSMCLSTPDSRSVAEIQTKEVQKRTISANETRLFADNKKVFLSVGGRVISVKSGFSTIVKIGTIEHHSLRAEWRLEKVNEQILRTVHSFPFGEQIIEWRIADSGQLDIVVSFQLCEVVIIDDFQLFMQIDKTFLNVAVCTDEGERRLPPHGVICARCSGAVGLLMQGQDSPLALNLFCDPSDHIGYELDDGQESDHKLIKVHKSLQFGEVFQCAVRFDEAQAAVFDVYKLRERDLLFWPRHNEAALYWKGKHITTGMGLYSSYYVAESGWNDSVHHTQRKVIYRTDTELHLEIVWKRIPLKQVWILNLLDDNRLELTIRMSVKERILFQKEQINVMLSGQFELWKSSDAQGEFPPTFTCDSGGDWQSLYQSHALTHHFTFSSVTTKEILPQVQVTCTDIGSNWCARIVNSDEMFKGRVLQYVHTCGEYIEPGEYDYFSGLIEVKE